jgi:regulator of protease activity HflC (stomatin/prohibitin superfamily)
MKSKQTAIIVAVVIIIFMLIFGSRMFHIIRPGERGLVFKTISGELQKDPEQIRQTGLNIIAPWNNMFRYVVREQQREETMDVLDKSGLSVNVDVTVRFNPMYTRIGYLHEQFGQEYPNNLVVPEVRSSVRKVMGRYTAEEIYSTKRNEVEEAIITETATILKNNNIDMRALLIRAINLPADIKRAIETKLTREQESLAMIFVLEKERQDAERRLIEAKGIANYNREINASITSNILKQAGIDATLKLAESPNTKVIVIGSGEDGLPMILGGN